MSSFDRGSRSSFLKRLSSFFRVIFTIDAKAAAFIVSQLEPKVIIPMHYKIEGLKFELDGVEKFLKEMGAENIVPQPKLSMTKEKLPEEPQVILLTKSS